MSWEQVKIQDIFDVARGGSPRPIDSFITEDEDGVNWIMIGDTKGSGKYITKTAKKIKPEGVKKSREVKEGDFLLTNSMSFGRPYVLKTNGCIHDGWLVLSPVNDNIHTDYFYYYLGSNEIKLKLSSKAAGAVVKNLNKDIVKNIKVPLPPLDQQKKIAAILDAADAYRQKTKALIEKYDELTQSLFLDMFGDPVTNPKGWTTKPMGELADLKMGGTPSTKHPEYYENGTINWMKSGDIKGDFIINFPNKITKLGLENSNTKLYNKNTVVIALNGQGKTRGTTGLITESTCSNQSVANIDPGNNMNSAFLHFQLKSRYKLLRNLTGDNDRSGLNLTILRNYKIYIPEMELQNQFAERVKAIEAQKAQAQVSLAQAEDLFNSLLQRAFKGELV